MDDEIEKAVTSSLKRSGELDVDVEMMQEKRPRTEGEYNRKYLCYKLRGNYTPS